MARPNFAIFSTFPEHRMMKNRILTLTTAVQSSLVRIYKRHSFPPWVQELARYAHIRWLAIVEKNRLTHADFEELRARFSTNPGARAQFLVRNFHCRPMIDPGLIRMIKRLQKDFRLKNFVETGTYDGDTSLFMSLIFDRVFTCDVKDYGRRPEFYLRDNLTYETETSPDFLRKHLPEIASHSVFYLDAHWKWHWPLRDELAIVFRGCVDPVVVIDDFDAGSGLEFEAYGGKYLNFDYIVDLLPPSYKFCVNTSSNRNKGLLFLFPGSAAYGCAVQERLAYSEKTHGLWEQ